MSAQFDTFMAMVMEPVPAEALHDQGYNQTMRKQRATVWRQRQAEMDMLMAERRFNSATNYYRRQIGNRESVTKGDLLERWMKVEKTLLLTPAPDRAALAWKRRRRPTG